MQIYDPTVMGPSQDNRRADPIDFLDGKTIAILENGKLNAAPMLHEIASVFAARHNCTLIPTYNKVNASAPAPEDTLQTAAQQADFLITGLGD